MQHGRNIVLSPCPGISAPASEEKINFQKVYLLKAVRPVVWVQKDKMHDSTKTPKTQGLERSHLKKILYSEEHAFGYFLRFQVFRKGTPFAKVVFERRLLYGKDLP